MKKKFLSGLMALAIAIPCAFGLVGCGEDPADPTTPPATPTHTHSYTSTITGYDESGNYCSWKACSCDATDEKTIIVQGVSETTATLAVTANENNVASTTFVEGTGFDEVVSTLNTRCESGTQTTTLKTTIETGEKVGLALSGNIKLTEDIVIGYNGNTTLGFQLVGNVTIDLNGHSITQQCGLSNSLSGYALFAVNEGVTVNIIDSSAEHNGEINAVSVAFEMKGGTVNLYDGTVKCGAMMTVYDTTPADDPLSVRTIWFQSGTFNQYGGKVETVATRDVLGGGTYTHTKWNYTFSKVGETYSGTVNLYGGEVIGETGVDEEAVTINDER